MSPDTSQPQPDLPSARDDLASFVRQVISAHGVPFGEATEIAYNVADRLRDNDCPLIPLVAKAQRAEVPDGWIESALLERGRYFVTETEDGWHVYTEDDHGAFS